MLHIPYTVLAVAGWVVLQSIYNVYLHPLRSIPGPFFARASRWWLFILEMRGHPQVEILELHRQYGPMLRISPNEVSFSGADAFSEIYGRTSKFNKSEFFYRTFEDQAHNLFTLRDRQQHSQLKRLLSNAFSRSNVVQHHTSIVEKAEYLVDRIHQRVAKSETIPLYPAFRCMTLDTISEFAFGKSIGALKREEFESVIFEAIDKANSSVPFFQGFPFLREALRWASYYNLSSIPNGFLELAHAADVGFQQMGEEHGWTMFGNMMASAAKSSRELSKDHLISEGIVMFVAGTDTTAASLAFTYHHLLQQPDLYQRLQEELRTVMPTLDSRPTMEELDALPFLNACIREGLRVSSPSRFRMPRTVPVGGWTFKGHYFPAETTVSMSPLYLLHDKTVFPSPTTYDPSRWLVEGDQKRLLMSHFHPFSSGTRQCIGQNLSLIEQKIVLSLLVRRFNCKDALKEKITTHEAITLAIDDPVEVRQRENTLLGDRLLALERKLQALEQDRESDRSSVRRTGSVDANASISAASQAGLDVQTTGILERSSDRDDEVDGMGSVALTDGGDEHEYFGPSSNLAFLSVVVRAIGNPVNADDRIPPSATGGHIDDVDEPSSVSFLRRPASNASTPFDEGTQRRAVQPFSLPPEREAEHLLRVYFTTVNLMIPCIHEESFRTTYKKVRSHGPSAVRRPWLGILNMLFALATNVLTPTSPLPERATRSKAYFEIALELVRPEMLRRFSLETVQLFLLMELYLEGTTSSSPEASAPLAFSSVSSGVTTLSLAYFDATMSITHVIGDVVEKLYDQNLGTRSQAPMSKTVDEISQLCWRLAQWQDNLPARLKIITSREAPDDAAPRTLETTRLRVLLSLRFLGARILVLRPILTQFLDLPGSSTANEAQGRWLCSCGAVLLADLVNTCRDVLHISTSILAASRNDQNLLGAWWFSCYYRVLLVKRIPLFSAELSGLSVTELRALLDTAMSILKDLDNGNKTILRCRDTLARLLMEFDLNGTKAHTDLGIGPTPGPFSLSPSSAWAWQLLEPGLFGSAQDSSAAQALPLPSGFEMPPSW
ncbi:uncharacterized protein DNG_09698 [Cephalotrichum gorgonifer]|uniref:P450 domain-containing protein n=1 Tax=Cephalotrichum gorgonifer TaxID=2041049 RepID=A0AAE8SZJ6_9PEZI|nr:uncharacterized protein DNG_09698 [Cephalotrichum gorgonifer]